MDSEEACQQIINGDIELAVITLPGEDNDRLEMKPVWNDPLCVVVSKQHPLAAESRLSIKQLLNHDAILPSRGTYTRKLIDAALGLDESVSTLLETHYLETIKAMVQAGLGWSMLPSSMLDKTLAALDIKHARTTRRLGIVVHSMRTKSNAISQLMKYSDES